jgi:tRNA pseudouridine55 synthase
MKYSRDVNGILLLDKPVGITSNAALQKVKKLFAAKKAGHGGSLDPLATGVLPIFFGKATKLSSILLEADKHYVTTLCLGERTDTGDADGKVIAVHTVPDLSLADIENGLSMFRGPLRQKPPMFSAIKHKGQPLYKLARQGIEIERKLRDVHIYDLQLVSHDNKFLTLDIKCSKGTYIRTIVDDLGQLFGCGAHITTLCRLATGPYKLTQAMSISDLNCLFVAGNYAKLDEGLIDACLMKDRHCDDLKQAILEN